MIEFLLDVFIVWIVWRIFTRKDRELNRRIRKREELDRDVYRQCRESEARRKFGNHYWPD